MSRNVTLGVALVAAALFLIGLDRAPFLDPPEGIHAQIAWEMLRRGDWITPHLDGVPYFDKPPLLYWVMAASFAVLGPTEVVARFWSALPAVAVAVLTARIGTVLAAPRVGLLAGLMVAANLGVFLFGRMVKPDLLFIAWIWLAFYAFVMAYLGAGQRWLFIFYTSLGMAALAKDLMGAIGPLVALAVLALVVREPQAWRRWAPWGGVALLLAVTVPWYALVEARNRGFLWYTVVDNHLLNMARQRVFPDEDVPLGALEFLVVTAAGFFPWVLTLPQALGRALRRPWETPESRMWLLFAIWTLGVVGFFTLSPFKLPHYGLPAFPAMALLVARVWHDALERMPDAPTPRALLIPSLILMGTLGLIALGFWGGLIPLPEGGLQAVDVTTRNMAAQGQQAAGSSLSQFKSLFGTLGLIFGLGAAGMAVALWRRQSLVGLGALMAVMFAFLPVTVQGLTLFAVGRSVRPMTVAIALKARPDDVLAHEGALENSASALIMLDRPVKIVNGLVSNLAFGSTFPEARGVFWDGRTLAQAWGGERRIFLLSAVRPAKSVVKELPAGEVHLLMVGGGRWLYSNRP
ncbi:MAG TPA: glycosyltransferase family 39 protein [Methylomirabilota bacterium]|nr:glycosyltransferase family 39 protein [Methylomirabilota bacterium]